MPFHMQGSLVSRCINSAGGVSTGVMRAVHRRRHRRRACLDQVVSPDVTHLFLMNFVFGNAGRGNRKSGSEIRYARFSDALLCNR